MRKFFLAAICLALLAPAALAEGPGDRPDGANMLLSQKSLQFTTAPPAGDGLPGIVLIINPEFYYASFGSLAFTSNGTDLEQEGGSSTGFGFTFIANKPFNSVFSLGFFYQFAYNNYEGGNFTQVGSDRRGWTEQRGTTHVIGLVSAIDLGRYGKIEPSIHMAWDAFDGTEFVFERSTNTLLGQSTPAVTGFRAVPLMVWYSLPIPVSESLILTPYVGWRGIYVVAHTADGEETNDWLHIISGGLSARYIANPNLSFVFRAGVSYRATADDIPGLSTRAVAPGIVHGGWMGAWDRTIATYGLAMDWNFGSGTLEVAYDGYKGSDITNHKGSVVLIFPF